MPLFKQPFGNYLLLGCVILTLRNLYINKEAFLFLLLALALEIYHNFTFDNYDFSMTRQVILLFATAIFIIYFIKLDFLPIYIDILFYFSLISFVFFALYYADNGLITGFIRSIPGTFVKTTVNYGVESKQVNPVFYNFDSNYTELGRNNGPFWEPTVFATMLIIAQIFNLLLNKKLFNKKGIVFSIAILTTFSTTGFLAYFLLLVAYFLFSDRIRTGMKVVMMGAVCAISIGLFTNLSFLSEKIDNEIEKTDQEMDKYGGDSRLASALMDLNEVTEKPSYILFGKGVDANSRIAGVDKEVLRNCGDTALLIQWGAIFFIAYIGLLFYSFWELAGYYEIHRGFAFVFTLIFLLLGFSEVYFDLPFFFSFLFFGFIIKKQYTTIIHDSLLHTYPGS